MTTFNERMQEGIDKKFWGTGEVYEKAICRKCGSFNLVYVGRPHDADDTLPSYDAGKCFKCGTVFWLYDPMEDPEIAMESHWPAWDDFGGDTDKILEECADVQNGIEFPSGKEGE